MPFRIIRNDITRVEADAIVNTANPKPTVGAGVDCAVYRAAGWEQLLAEREKIGKIAPGECAVTPAFDLPARYVIHTVGPLWQGGTAGEFDLLASCYRKSLLLAKQLGCQSVAFPLISTGTYGFPKDKALEIALREFRTFLDDSDEAADMDLTLVVFDRKAYELSDQLVSGVEAFIDENYAAEKSREERRSSRNGVSVLSNIRERLDYRRRRRAEEAKAEADYYDLEEAAEIEALLGVEEADEEEMGVDFDAAPSPSASMPSSMPHAGSAAPPPSYAAGSAAPPPSHAAGSAAPPPVPEEHVYAKPSASGYALPTHAAKKKEKKSLQDVIFHVGEKFQQKLLRLIDERELTDTEVYKKANIDRKLFSKIRCNPDYQPKKRTALALAMALELNLDETIDLIGRAGFALSPGNIADLIIEYCIENRIYDLTVVNSILFDYDQQLLGL